MIESQKGTKIKNGFQQYQPVIAHEEQTLDFLKDHQLLIIENSLIRVNVITETWFGFKVPPRGVCLLSVTPKQQKNL
jgi:hypothetical protein